MILNQIVENESFENYIFFEKKKKKKKKEEEEENCDFKMK
jgi:hypothetical protein